MFNSTLKTSVLKIKVLRLLNIGILNYGDNVLEKNKHQLLSAIAILLNTFNIISLFVYFIFGFYWQILLVSIMSIIIHILYLNLRKQNSFFYIKFLGFQTVLIFLFLSSSFHGYQTVFNHFYLIFLAIIPFVFDNKEFKYQIILLFQAIFLFFMQNLYGKDYLPNLNLLPSDKINTYNYLMITIMIIYIFGLSLLGAIINQYQENKLKKLKKKLFTTTNKLHSQNNELRTFGMAATHSLKTPLFIINSLLNKIKDNLQQNESKELIPYYINLIRESNLLNEKYSDDLIKYTSLYNIEKNYERINLKKTIERSASIVLLNHKNANLINEIPSDFYFNTNISLLEIIVECLADNGLKYNQSTSPTIKIYAKINDREASIFFEDNGIGITDEYREKIFEPFNRINKIETIVGSGLGLSIAHLAAVKINATLTLESSENGSTFKLKINL